MENVLAYCEVICSCCSRVFLYLVVKKFQPNSTQINRKTADVSVQVFPHYVCVRDVCWEG